MNAEGVIKKDTRDTIGMASAQVIGVTNVTSLIAIHTRSQGMRHRNTMAMEKDYQRITNFNLYIHGKIERPIGNLPRGTR